MNWGNRWYFNPVIKIQKHSRNEDLVDQRPGLSPSRSFNDVRQSQHKAISNPSRPPSNRVCKDVSYPMVHKLRVHELFDDRYNNQPNIGLLVHHFRHEGRLAEATWRQLISQAKAIFRQESNIICLSRGCTIVGDIHGQFYDLLTILHYGGRPGQQPYVFLGDYVDRGSFSCECLFLLLAFKIRYPRHFILLRGNHESRQMTQAFTFQKECEVKYSLDLWHESMALFDCFPICALIDKRFLCIHGGISPTVRSLNDIAQIDRFQEIPTQGTLCDLLWSDPRQPFYDPQTPPWTFNDNRRCSYCFDYNACEQFLLNNHLLAIIRAHEVVPNGLLPYENGSLSQFPVLISLFSAPNYCDAYNNIAAIMIYDEHRNIRPIYFAHQPHPFVLPNHENAFEFGNRLMKTIIEEILLVLVRNSVVPCGQSKGSDSNDKISKSLKDKEKMLKERTQQSRRLTTMTLELGNLAPPEAFREKALQNNNVFKKESPSLGKSLANGSSLTFESAMKIDALYEQRPS